MCFIEKNNGGSKRAYTATNIQRKRGPTFAVISPYLPECSFFGGYLYYHNAYDCQRDRVVT